MAKEGTKEGKQGVTRENSPTTANETVEYRTEPEFTEYSRDSYYSKYSLSADSNPRQEWPEPGHIVEEEVGKP